MEKISSGMGSMQGNIANMSDGLTSTAKSIRSQALAIALDQVMKPENLYFINLSSVNPASIIPASKAFGEMATPEEISGLAYLWISDLNIGAVDATTQEKKDEADTFKLRRLVVLQTIAGMLTEEKTAQLIKSLGGEYDSATYALLALRHGFLSSYFLDVGLLTKAKLNKSEYRAGMKAIKSLMVLENLIFRNKCELKLFGFFSTDLNQTVTIENKAEELRKRLDAMPKENP